MNHDIPYTNEGLETFWDDQLIVVKPPAPAEWMSVDYPVHLWHTVGPGLQILVVASSMRLAHHYADLSRRMESPSPRIFIMHNAVTNEAGGSIYYTSPEAALAGLRFDRIIISDPLQKHLFDERMGEWLNEAVRCHLKPVWPAPWPAP